MLTYFQRLLSRSRRRLAIFGLAALAIIVVAAYTGALLFSFQLIHGGVGERAPKSEATRDVALQPNDGGTSFRPPKFPASDYRQSNFPKLGGYPLVGVNYTHYAFPQCNFDGTGILAYYENPGVAQRVHAQLMQMRKSGVATIRTVIWHMTDPTGLYWGPISSAGGTLHEPNRTNLIQYLTELRRFGFLRLTVSFVPQQTNNPLLRIYRPSKFRENWRFIKTVRSLVKRYGPRHTRIDLLSEGAPSSLPSDWSPVPWQTSRYLRAIYRLYVTRFGNRDVTVSSIASEPTDVANRLQTLVQILKSTGEPLPRWYDVHVPYNSAGASYALQQIDSVLNRDRQDQPLVIGETAYDNLGIAQTVRDFLRTSSRRIEEVSPWYLRTLKGCQVAPPYKPGAYGRELSGPLAR
jgi:hypothetical protein